MSEQTILTWVNIVLVLVVFSMMAVFIVCGFIISPPEW